MYNKKNTLTNISIETRATNVYETFVAKMSQNPKIFAKLKLSGLLDDLKQECALAVIEVSQVYNIQYLRQTELYQSVEPYLVNWVNAQLNYTCLQEHLQKMHFICIL